MKKNYPTTKLKYRSRISLNEDGDLDFQPDFDNEDAEYEYRLNKGPAFDSSLLNIEYKQNHKHLPVLILPDHRLLIYTEAKLYPKVYPHLISFSEPIYRPKVIHEYRITKFSLYTAMVLHYSGEQIVEILQKISKNLIFPQSLALQIRTYMKYAGEVRFHLIKGQYYLYTNKEIVEMFLKSYLEYLGPITIEESEKYHLTKIEEEIEKEREKYALHGDDDDENQLNDGQNGFHRFSARMDEGQDEDSDQGVLDSGEQEQQQRQNKKSSAPVLHRQLYKYKIREDYFKVTRTLIEQNIPIVQQFDFLHSPESKSINIDMISDLSLRYYQQRALKNVFIDDMARSGIIILPCGAGKSLVAITIIGRIKKNAVIFCQSQVSAQQWRSQLLKWTTINRDSIIILSPKLKDKNPHKIRQCSVLITTYSMVGMKRIIDNKYLLQSQQISWGVCIADQVHKLPAETFQQVLKKYKFYLKIGLTATPYREDQKINNLFFMIGPKLYEENWLDLVNEGCLAKPYCVEILCEMSEKFKETYRNTNQSDLIHTANPTKFKALQYLLKKHSYCHDKILVFCDRPKVLQFYAKKLKMPYIHGDVTEQQRVKIYNLFKSTKDINILFLSRVGDTAIDLPCANVGIQLGIHYKSRRQQVQRMGRIMRAKQNPNNQYNAFFYSLVSLQTKELTYSRKRQKCLVDQGFQYEILLEKNLNYDEMKILKIDEHQYLLKILSEHEEGDMYLMKRTDPKEQKLQKEIVQTKKIQGTNARDGLIMQEGVGQDYYYEEIDEEESSENENENN